ncbi:NADH-quinone oxidoreductase subunit C [Streptomyces sp. NPDC060030]|uniref:NADH-quinone oxidoreductase subunit C n=1 Tax=Streptomyces sp. NPDC060030 TaxID=3347042 RepID=UPI003696DA5B
MTASDASGPSDAYDRLPDAVTDVFGADATAAHAYDLLTVDVPAASWIRALETARDELGCTYFDWLSAVDEPGTGFRVCAHVAALGGGTVRRLLLRTTVPHEAAGLPTAVGVYAGAAWHERETHEMFGIDFADHPHLVPLLLPDSFEGHPLRKDFVLAARVAKAWPGAKEPGESEHGGPKRRTMLPPGVPDPNEWGPLKGQLPPAPARPARAARAAGDRPVRRARSASEGSAAQRTDAAETPQTAPPRRTRSASQGSASQATGSAPESPATTPPAATPPAGTTESGTEESGTTESGTTTDSGTTGAGKTKGGGDATRAKGAAGSADAPWHDAQPAFGDAPEQPAPEQPAPKQSAPVEPGQPLQPEPEQPAAPEPEQPPVSEPEAKPERPSAPGPEQPVSEVPAQPSQPEPEQPVSEPEPEQPSQPAPEQPPVSEPEPDPDSPGDSPGPDRPTGGDAA